MSSTATKKYVSRTSTEALILKGWFIPASQTVNFDYLADMSRRIGVELRLWYNAKRREFVLYTQQSTVELDSFMTTLGFIPQTIKLRHAVSR